MSVHHPLSLRATLKADHEEDSEGLLKARMANFGHLPYGSSFLARVYYPPSQAVRHACDATQVMKDEGLRKVKQENAESIIVFVESGGGCSVPFKV